MTSDSDPLDAFLVARAAETEVGPCPDAGAVAGFAERRLSEPEAERVAAHAAGCAACRAAILALAGAEDAGLTAVEEPRRRLRHLVAPRAIAIAAMLLVAVGIGAVLLSRSSDEDEGMDLDARLVAAARDLASVEPDLFGGFTPLSHAERLSVRDGRERGGLRLLAPMEVVLSDRPGFRWVEVPGSTRYDVAVGREGAAPSWRRVGTTGHLAYPSDAPPLERGARHAWTVATEGVLGGRTEARGTFVVASGEEAEAFARAERAVADRVPADVASLLAAHWALRRGFLEEAERLAREHVARDPKGAAGIETLRTVLRRRGAPDADEGNSAAGDAR